MSVSPKSEADVPRVIALCELGAIGVETDGQCSAVRGSRMSILLAALGLAGRSGVGTEELMEMIWPSPDQPPTARQSLANIVLRARTAHGSSFIESTGRGYRLGDQVQSHRARFLADVEHAGELVAHAPERALESVEQALTRWRGEPWAGMERPAGVEADRAHLLQVRANALRVRATALIALNRQEPALADLRDLLLADPYDEFSRYHMVRILADTGQRAEALHTIQKAHQLFSRRGLALDAALVDMEQRLLSARFMSDAETESLPVQPTEFIGREREVEATEHGLRVSRLVTLHGIGGSGKTRLAVHVADTINESGKSGFVALADARSAGQVELAFARGLGLPVNRLDGLDTDERRKALADAAAASAGLLVIDNCEHVISDVRAIVGRLIARPGLLRMLATSRVPLEIAGERRYPIPEFSDGPELFRLRAQSQGVPIDPDRDADVVAEVCELVGHLPLAIEIAAAQTPYRTLREIADEVGQGVVHRDATRSEPRHETISAAIRWSHELLDPAAADSLVRLGIFDAPFEQIDAAAVIEGDDVSEVLDTLVRSSLVERNDHDGRSTYRLAVPVRQYCAAELAQRGATTQVAIALADWLIEFTDRPYGDVWWRLCVIDDISIRLPHALSAVAALRAVGRADDAALLASRLGGAGHLYGHADELIEMLTELWPTCSDAEVTADALLALVICADVARRGDVFGPALGLLAAIDGTAGRRHRVFVHCLHSLLFMFAARLTDEDYGLAHDELQRARELGGALESPINRAHIEQWQSGIHLFAGDWEAAETAARRSLKDSAGTKVDWSATSCLCHARLQLGDPDMALHLATNHPHRNLHTAFGDRLGIVAAIARIQCGDTDSGLDEISEIQRQASETPWAAQQDDVAIAIAYIAHLLRQDDLTLQILETGVLGFGPWIGYLVPKMCRDLHIPVTAHGSDTGAGPRSKSEYIGATANRVLDELVRRRPDAVRQRP